MTAWAKAEGETHSMNGKKEKAERLRPEENRARIPDEGIIRRSRHKQSKEQSYLYHGVSGRNWKKGCCS